MMQISSIKQKAKKAVERGKERMRSQRHIQKVLQKIREISGKDVKREGVLKRNPSLDKADYVGFSNGCRAALDALSEHGNGYSNNWKIENTNGTLNTDTSLPANPIDTFVGVGCPGAFEGDSLVKTGLNFFGESSSNSIKANNLKHATLRQFLIASPGGALGNWLVGFLNKNDNKDKISVNLFNQYVDWAKKTTDSQPGNISVGKAAIIEGRFYGKLNPFYPVGGDLVVTINDQKAIYDNTNANSKKRFIMYTYHGALPEDFWTQRFIRKTLNNESLTWYEKIGFLAEED